MRARRIKDVGLLEGAQPKKIVEIAQRFFYTGIKISYLNTAKKTVWMGYGAVFIRIFQR